MGPIVGCNHEYPGRLIMPTFGGDDVACLLKHYNEIEETLDQLGGDSPIFQQLWVNFIVDRRRKDVSKHDLWMEMVRLRKTGGLLRKKRAAPKPKTKEPVDDEKPDQGDVPGDRRRGRPRKTRRDDED